MFLSAVILAAGGSRRMGRSKPLLPFAGEPLICRLAQRVLAAAPDELLVVLGYRSKDVTAALSGLPLRLVENPAWADGQSTSVTAAIGALSPAATAAIFIPCDQPHLTPEVIQALIRAHQDGYSPIVVPVTDGERRSPVLISARLFPELITLSDDRGARQIFARHQGHVHEVPISDARALEDIDTWDDYERLVAGCP